MMFVKEFQPDAPIFRAAAYPLCVADTVPVPAKNHSVPSGRAATRSFLPSPLKSRTPAIWL